jgi:lipoprotein-anchoring transpeptidase ErfK/SrfK
VRSRRVRRQRIQLADVRGWLAGRCGRRMILAIATAPVLLAASCSASGTASGTGTTSRTPAVVRAKHQPVLPRAELTISPANGSTNVAPGEGITVTASHGRIERVSVRSAGDPVTGSLGPGGSTWRSEWTLGVSQRYTVTATAFDSAAHSVTATSSFRTLTPQRTFQTEIFEGYLLTYGVGMPIELDFSNPITDKAAVERSLQIATSKPVVGAWYWSGDEQVDFRPRTYWPVGTRVSFTGHLDGVEGAPGVYGFHTLTQTFLIGPSLIVVASTATHHMDVYYDGHRRYYWPISTGRPGLDTPDGTYLTIMKANPQDMVGPGYNLEVPWSVRITLSGDFLHDAYWSVGEQGFTNVSHGCVNMPPADAEIYYNMAVPGDPVTITGSPLAGTWGNGFTEWFLSWDQLLEGSAIHKAVRAGPTGSSFVNPRTLAPVHALAPLQTSAPHNSAAA